MNYFSDPFSILKGDGIALDDAEAAALGKFVAICRQCIIGAASALPSASATIP